MFITKGIIYIVLTGLAAIAGIMLMGFVIAKRKKMQSSSKILMVTLSLFCFAATAFGIYQISIHTVNTLKTTVNRFKNFPETVESSNNNDTTDYVRIVKSYEPLKYRGKVIDDYYTFYGFRDWWRFPVVYPYSLTCIDILDRGAIVNDSATTDFQKGGTTQFVTPYFTGFVFNSRYMAAQMTEDDKLNNHAEYFIFEFETGKTEFVVEKTTLIKKLAILGFGENPPFITIRSYSQRF